MPDDGIISLIPDSELKKDKIVLSTILKVEQYFSCSRRALLYRLAAESGLRANELRSLKVSSFDFKNRIVSVKSRRTKNKKEAILPLRRDTISELKDFFKDKLPGTKAFGGTYIRLTDKTANILIANN